jgi:hypothetical protein
MSSWCGSPCPLRVISGHRIASAPCPLYPQKQTSDGHQAMSALCQKRTSPIYSINSSARPDRGSGTVMPSAFAVLRLMQSSTLVDC